LNRNNRNVILNPGIQTKSGRKSVTITLETIEMLPLLMVVLKCSVLCSLLPSINYPLGL
jgi:hypothetical protein